ncbi:MAG: hypothetical protein K8J31_23435 [Anaerolineae bacterium]|nr:hypothetical protein [Anaerolineae bacterium]
MFNLVRRMIALSGIACMLLLAGVLWVVHRQPLPEIEAGLALCAVPCWAGLEPGRTLVDDVPAIVQARMDDPSANLQPYQRYTAYVVDVPGRNVLGAISAQDGKVSTIRLNVVQPLWPLLMMLDTPRCIEPVDNSYGLTVINIYWEIDDVYVMSNLTLSHWNPDYLTNALYVWIPTSTPPCEKSGQVLPWPGYAALP